MTTADFPLSQSNDTARRRVLAEVYDFLIRLTEELENPQEPPVTSETLEGSNGREAAKEGATIDLVSAGIILDELPEKIENCEPPAP
jgi:hypothetical protein